MKIGLVITFLAMTVKGFETSGDGSTDSDSVVDNVINVNNVVNIMINTETNSAASVVIDTGLCVGKCDSLPNTECKIVKSNSNGYTCPCIAGFELNNAGKCIEETVSVNTVRATTDQVTNQDTTNPTTVQARVRIVGQKCLCNKYRDLTLVQADVTFPTEQNNWEKSTPNSGSILTSMAGILVCASFL